MTPSSDPFDDVTNEFDPSEIGFRESFEQLDEIRLGAAAAATSVAHAAIAHTSRNAASTPRRTPLLLWWLRRWRLRERAIWSASSRSDWTSDPRCSRPTASSITAPAVVETAPGKRRAYRSAP